MKTTFYLTISIAFLLILFHPMSSAIAKPIGTGFTYQGRLLDANNVADGLYDFQFELFDASSGGNKLGADINESKVDVTDGYFTVELNFGPIFDGNERWLQIGVRPGSGNFTTLSPRQQITPTPYAISDLGGGAPVRKTKGTATVTVAPYDAPADIKAMADYVCDGTDDGLTIQEAINITPVGGSVYCHDGNYSATTTILLPSYITFQLGNRAILNVPGNGSKLTVYTARGYPYIPLITNNDHDNGNSGIVVSGGYINFHGDLKDPNNDWAGIWFDNCTHSRIEYTRIYDVVYGADAAGWYAYGTLFSQCYDCHVFKCDAEHIGYEGFGIRGACRLCSVVQCTGRDNSSHLAQVARFIPKGGGIAGDYGNNEDILFDGLMGEGDICSHKAHKSISITGVSQANDTFTVAGDKRDNFRVGARFTVEGSAGNDGDYTCRSITYSVNTVIGVEEDVKGATANGNIKTLNKRVTISNCHVSTITALDEQRDLTIANNDIDGQMILTASADTNFNGALITGNTIQHSSSSSPSSINCLQFVASGTGGAFQGITVSNNTFKWGKIYFHISSDSTTNIRDVIFTDNKVYGYQNNPSIYFRIEGAGDINGVKIQNNALKATATNAGDGIQIYNTGAGDLTHLQIIGNTINAGYGLNYKHTGTGLFAGCIMSDNIMTLTARVFDGNNGMSDMVIKNNNIISCSNVIGGAGADDILVEGNIIRHMSSGFTDGNPANVIVRNNVGYVTENGGVTSVADGGSIAHGLAGTPTYVIVTPSIPGEMVSVTAGNSSTFTVAIKKHDGSTGTTQNVYWHATYVP